MKPDIDLRASRWRAQESGQRTVERIMGGERFYIFGLTKYGKSVAKFARDVGRTALNSFDGISVVRTESIAAATAPLIINAVVESRPYSVDLFLLGKGFFASTSYFHLHAYNNAAFPLPFAAHNMLDIDNRLSAYAALEETLADATSKKEWRAVQYSRYSMDYLTGQLRYRLEEQYWEPEIYDISKKGHFIDGGCYDGNTSREFARRNPKYQKISAFAPISLNMEKAQVNLSGCRDVDFYPLALHKDMAVRTFSENHSASGITVNGDIAVPCAPLDSIMEGKPVHFLKLDVEGSELVALEGAQNTIRQHVPTIAICVYHDQRYFLEIPKTILSWVPEYRLYFRHYTEGIFESVMYFEKG